MGLHRPLFPMGWNYGWLYLEPGKQCCRELICALPTLWGIDTLPIVFSIYSVISQPWFIPWAPQRSRGILSSNHPHSTVSNASACPQTHLQTESTGNTSWVFFWLRQHTRHRWSKAMEKKEHSLSAGSFYPQPQSREGRGRELQGICWSVSLLKMMSSRFSERPKAV